MMTMMTKMTMMVCVQNPTCTKCTWWPWWPIWLLISHLVRRAAHLDRRLRPVWHRVQAQQQTFEGKTCAQSIFGGGWYCFESRNTHLWGLLYNCEWLILFSSSSNNNYLFIWYYFFYLFDIILSGYIHLWALSKQSHYPEERRFSSPFSLPLLEPSTLSLSAKYLKYLRIF